MTRFHSARTFGLGLLTLLSTMALSSCSPESKTEQPEAAAGASTSISTVATAAADSSAQSLKVSLFFLNYSLDPKDYFNAWILIRAGVGESLLRLSDTGEVLPHLAESFSVDSPTAYTIKLKSGLTFSDGTPVTARDAKLSIERVMALNPRGRQYFALDHIDLSTTDELTLTIHTKEPVPELFYNLCEPLFTVLKLPENALPDASSPTVWPDVTLQLPVGTGPYKVTAFVPNESIHVERNEHYYAKSQANSSIEAIDYLYMVDEQSRVMALQAGEVDLIPTVNQASLPLFADSSKYQVLRRISPRTNVVYINHQNPLLAHDAVRTAMNLALNREQIVALIGGEKANSLIAPAFVGRPSSGAGTGAGAGSGTGAGANAAAVDWQSLAPYSLPQAAQVLDAAGLVDSNDNGTRDINGTELSFNYYLKADHGSADSSLIAQSMQQDFAKIGIELKLFPAENLASIMASGTFDFFSANDSTVPTGDPYYFLYTRFHTKGEANYGHYSNATVDSLLEQMQQSFEVAKRQELTYKVLVELQKDSAALFVNHIEINEVASTRLQDLHLYSFDYYFIDDKVGINQ